MAENCDAMVIFPIYGKSDFGHIDCKTYILIKSNLLSYKNWKQQKFLTQPSQLSKGTILAKKRNFFAKKCWHQQN